MASAAATLRRRFCRADSPSAAHEPNTITEPISFRLLPSFHAVDPLSVLFFDNNRLMKRAEREQLTVDRPLPQIIQSGRVCTRNHCRSAVRAERYRLCVLRRSNFIKSEQGRRHGFEQHDRRLPFRAAFHHIRAAPDRKLRYTVRESGNLAALVRNRSSETAVGEVAHPLSQQGRFAISRR